MTEMLAAAFRALGSAARPDEVVLVANALRASDDDETKALLDAAAHAFKSPEYERVRQIAEETGAGPFVALDLVCEFRSPGNLRRKDNSAEAVQ